MSELFTEVSDQQQELVAGGAMTPKPLEPILGKLPKIEPPNYPMSPYPMPPTPQDPRHDQESCPACGMG
jgi:hypothetical protein